MKRIKPLPGQESVWDYPRPPSLEPVSEHLRIIHEGQVICDSNQSYRILETSHPPTYYLPISAFSPGTLQKTTKSSYCEFKGMASYYHIIVGGKKMEFAAWGYENPSKGYLPLKNHVSVYATKVDQCYVGGEEVKPQEGDFYGGWITSKIVGPFKGGAGTWGW